MDSGVELAHDYIGHPVVIKKALPARLYLEEHDGVRIGNDIRRRNKVVRSVAQSR